MRFIQKRTANLLKRYFKEEVLLEDFWETKEESFIINPKKLKDPSRVLRVGVEEKMIILKAFRLLDRKLS